MKALLSLKRINSSSEPRGRNHSDADDVDARGREPRDDGGLEELAARPAVAPHQGPRPVSDLEHPGLTQHVRGRDRQVERQFGSQIDVRLTAHAIGPKESAHARHYTDGLPWAPNPASALSPPRGVRSRRSGVRWLLKRVANVRESSKRTPQEPEPAAAGTPTAAAPRGSGGRRKAARATGVAARQRLEY